MKYSIKIIRGTFQLGRAIDFYLYENGMQIARGTRKASRYEIRFNFFTINSEVRFQTFCNTLSMSEVCEILPVRK